jgi:adenylate kinase
VGPPGAGKSTQATRLSQATGLPIVAAGDLLRAEARRATPAGARVAAALAQGALVDDDTVEQLVAARMAEPDCARGIIFDGFPRTLAQAHFLERLLARQKYAPPTVIYLDVPDDVLIDRLSVRSRSDDTRQAVAARLLAWHGENARLLAAYPDHHRIRGDRTRDQVFRDIVALLPAHLRKHTLTELKSPSS